MEKTHENKDLLKHNSSKQEPQKNSYLQVNFQAAERHKSSFYHYGTSRRQVENRVSFLIPRILKRFFLSHDYFQRLDKLLDGFWSVFLDSNVEMFVICHINHKTTFKSNIRRESLLKIQEVRHPSVSESVRLLLSQFCFPFHQYFTFRFVYKISDTLPGVHPLLDPYVSVGK